jgi:hypothetical protein
MITGIPFGPRVALERDQNLLAAQVGQVQVEHDHIGLMMTSELDAKPPLPGRSDRDRGSGLEYALDELDAGDVVLHVQQPNGGLEVILTVLAGLNEAIHGIGLAALRGELKLRRERGSDPRLAVHGERSSHHLHQLPGERQAQSGSFDIAELRPEPLKRSKDLGKPFSWNPAAGVVNKDPQAGVGRLTEDPYFTPWRLYLIAFESRFSTTCLSRCGSART